MKLPPLKPCSIPRCGCYARPRDPDRLCSVHRHIVDGGARAYWRDAPVAPWECVTCGVTTSPATYVRKHGPHAIIGASERPVWCGVCQRVVPGPVYEREHHSHAFRCRTLAACRRHRVLARKLRREARAQRIERTAQIDLEEYLGRADPLTRALERLARRALTRGKPELAAAWSSRLMTYVARRYPVPPLPRTCALCGRAAHRLVNGTARCWRHTEIPPEPDELRINHPSPFTHARRSAP